MARRVKWTGWYARGSGVGELRAGDRGRGDDGPAYCDTKPQFTLSQTQVVGTDQPKFMQLAQVLSQRCCVGWEILDDNGALDVLDTASLHFEFATSANPTSHDLQFLTFREGGEGGTIKWGVRIRRHNALALPTTYGRVYIADGGAFAGTDSGGYSTGPGGGAYRYMANQVHRFEVSLVAGTVTVTAWNDQVDSVVPRFTLTTSGLSDPTFDTIEFGVNGDTHSAAVGMSLSHVPVADLDYKKLLVYDTDETPFGQYTETDQWKLWNGATLSDLTVAGKWDGTQLVELDPFKGTTSPVGSLVRGPHTKYSDLATGYGNMDLYVPTGTAPAAGWPVVFWGFSGFFIGGGKNQIVERWVRDMVANGFAVAAVGYRVANYVSGRHHPDLLHDYKGQAAWLRDNAATYDIDTSRMYATGYSAGGWLAAMATVTRGVTDDGAGRDLTIPEGDPAFAGCFVWAAPIDLEQSVADDPVPGALGFPAVETGVRTLLNQPSGTIDYTGVLAQEYVASGFSVPIAYCRGRWDELVGENPQIALADACTAAGKAALYTGYEVRADHDSIDENFDATPVPAPSGSQQIIDWIATVEAA